MIFYSWILYLFYMDKNPEPYSYTNSVIQNISGLTT